MTSLPPSVGPKDENDWLNVVMIGNGYFEQPMPGKKENEVFVDKVTKQELKLLQKDIDSIIQPPYCQALPQDLGNPGYGKLKADQWKMCIEFDIPVSVAQLWSRLGQSFLKYDASGHCCMLGNIVSDIREPFTIV